MWPALIILNTDKSQYSPVSKNSVSTILYISSPVISKYWNLKINISSLIRTLTLRYQELTLHISRYSYPPI